MESLKKVWKDAPLIVLMVAIGFPLFLAMWQMQSVQQERKLLLDPPKKWNIKLSDGTRTSCTQSTRGRTGLDFAGCTDGTFYLEQTNVTVYK